MATRRPHSFREFWPYYVHEHQSTGTQVLHFIGSSLGLMCLLAAIITGQVVAGASGIGDRLCFCLVLALLRRAQQTGNLPVSSLVVSG